MRKFEFKFRKILSWKVFWDFLSYFKWDWIEFDDFRPYIAGDDVRSINWKLTAKYDSLFINLFKQQKDSEIHILFDINRNWNWYDWNKYTKEKIYELFSDLLIFSNKFKANIIWYYPYKNDLKLNKISNNFAAWYWFIKRIDWLLEKQSYFYSSSISEFLKIQKKLRKKRIIIIVSDFLSLSWNDVKILNILKKYNEVLLFRFSIAKIEGLNYNSFNYNYDLIKNLNTYISID